MNFFKLYIGDYQRDTGTLTLAEHGAYMLMLQHYYASERPLPAGRELHRLLRAETPAERRAIDAIAARFWRTTDAGLVNERADEEITKARAQATTNRGIARAREERRREARREHDSWDEPIDDQSTNRATIGQPNHSQTKPPVVPLPGDSPPSVTSIAYPPGFERFWRCWPQLPRKRGKGAAARAWRKAGCEREAERICADVQRRASADPQWRAGYDPLPTSYLNGRQWEDGVEFVAEERSRQVAL